MPAVAFSEEREKYIDYNFSTVMANWAELYTPVNQPITSLTELEGKIHKSTGSGNGGFDAFMNAIAKVFKPDFYVLPKLEDFEIRIPRGGNTNALTECIITWKTEHKSIKTRGVHANQVFAAILATTRVINLQLHELSVSSVE